MVRILVSFLLGPLGLFSANMFVFPGVYPPKFDVWAKLTFPFYNWSIYQGRQIVHFRAGVSSWWLNQPNPLEKYVRQIRSFPPSRGKNNTCFKPPPIAYRYFSGSEFCWCQDPTLHQLPWHHQGVPGSLWSHVTQRGWGLKTQNKLKILGVGIRKKKTR